jgi:hypothetical protein
MTLLYVPVEHGVHVEEPDPLYVPTGHDKHAALDDAPTLLLYVPAEHGVHVEELEA